MSMNVQDVFSLIEKLPGTNTKMIKKSVDTAFEKMLNDADSQELKNTIEYHRNQVKSSESVEEIRKKLELLEKERQEIEN